MPIFANLVGNGINTNSRFIDLMQNAEAYADEVETKYKPVVGAGGSDHFISTIKCISNLTGMKNADNNFDIPGIIKKINSTPILRSWLSACLSAIIYSFENGNKISIHPLKFDDTNQYLRIWSEKLQINGDNMNTADPSSDYANTEALNLISFGKDNTYEDWLGCLSNWCFVIPMKEYFAANDENNRRPWKKFYKKMMEQSNIIGYADTLNIRSKIMLRLSAENISPNAPAPLLVLKEIIRNNIKTGGVDIAGNYPVYKTLCHIPFFNTEAVQDLDKIISNTLYIGFDKISYYATYPFTPELVRTLKQRKASLEDIKFSVEKDPSEINKVISARFTCLYNSEIQFILPINALASNFNTSLKYSYKVDRTYGEGTGNRIKSISMLRSFCMYPNISVEKEAQCGKFVFLGIDNHNILLEEIKGVDTDNTYTDDTKVSIVYSGSPDDKLSDNDNEEILRLDMNRVTTIDYDTRLHLIRTEVSKPIHFIEVRKNNSLCGYIMNMRSATRNKKGDIISSDVPALLQDGEEVNISFAKPEKPNGTMFAYVDFGSSSSSYRYKLDGATELSRKSVKDSSIMRMLLAGYNADRYRKVINLPEVNNDIKFMSVSAKYQAAAPINDFTPYLSGWMPVISNVPEYLQDIQLESSQKTELVNGNPHSPQIIINNLCYTIACNAVAENCSSVTIVPSLPSESYHSNLNTIWDDAITKANNFFPSLKIYNALGADEKSRPFLYESIAVSNSSATLPGQISVCIDIGDGTTDMSAVFNSGGKSELVGYSSIEYAGKDLIKATIKDVIKASTNGVFRYRLDGHPPCGKLFILNPGVDIKEFDGKANNLINNCYPNAQMAGDDRYEIADDDQNEKTDYDQYKKADVKNLESNQWQNKIIDILSISDLSDNLDPKIAADLVIRYLLMMPVIRDFIKVSATQAKLKGDVTGIRIKFTGGASKGFKKLSRILGNNNIAANIVNYLHKEAPVDDVSVTGVDDKELPADGKELLINGLDALKIKPDSPVGITGADNITVEWQTVNPTDPVNFGNPDSIHKDCLRKPFRPNDGTSGTPGEVGNYNRNTVIKDVSSHYDSSYSSIKSETEDYLKKEIIEKMIRSGSKYPGIIDTLLSGLLSEGSKDYLVGKLQGLAAGEVFTKACEQSIYPEMIKDAAFMYAFSSLITDHFGELKEGSIADATEAEKYKFGVLEK